jgi:hypothetical protein
VTCARGCGQSAERCVSGVGDGLDGVSVARQNTLRRRVTVTRALALNMEPP